VIDAAETLAGHGLRIIEREVAPHNRTRYAVLGHHLAAVSGYDATT
jgi:chorismate mutase / prephenate dehydratase